MKDLESLKITNPAGDEVIVKVITILKTPDEEKSFLIYTFDEKEENVDIYASVIKEENNSYILEKITNEEDWNLIQEAIKELAEE